MGLVDFDVLLFDPIYTVFGEVAVLTLADTAGTVLQLTAIDQTKGIVTQGNSRFNAEVQTVEPAASVQASALAGVDLGALREATLLLNGKTWTVRGHEMKPTPKGEAVGEILLLLTELA